VAQIDAHRAARGKKPIKHPKLEKRDYTSLYTIRFARVTVDEAHALRNFDTLLAESVKAVIKLAIMMLSTTPVLNHSKDLTGYLFQIFRAI